MDITLIETMPLGDTGEDRTDQYVPLSRVRSQLEKRYALVDLLDTTGGPARYVRIAETGGRLGFITPLTHNFCETCNRVRVSCNGTLFMCLGKDDRVDLRRAVRASSSDVLLNEAIDAAMRRKPFGHDFIIDRRGQSPMLARHMSVTGG
jgi:cyclic pyranopterin phosphate synthase